MDEEFEDLDEWGMDSDGNICDRYFAPDDDCDEDDETEDEFIIPVL